jgi:hypothetical protein
MMMMMIMMMVVMMIMMMMMMTMVVMMMMVVMVVMVMMMTVMMMMMMMMMTSGVLCDAYPDLHPLGLTLHLLHERHGVCSGGGRRSARPRPQLRPPQLHLRLVSWSYHLKHFVQATPTHDRDTSVSRPHTIVAPTALYVLAVTAVSSLNPGRGLTAVVTCRHPARPRQAA